MDVEKLIGRARNYEGNIGPLARELIAELAEALSRQKAAGDAMAEALRRIRDQREPTMFEAFNPLVRCKVIARSALTAWDSIEQGDVG